MKLFQKIVVGCISRIHYFNWKLQGYFAILFQPPYRILSIENTIAEIINNKLSISRYGDGEFILMLGKRDIVFQELTSEISLRLHEVINSNVNNHMVCLTSALISRKGYKKDSQNHWREFVRIHGAELANQIKDHKKNYGNSLISRFYHHKTDKKDVPKIVQKLRQIWNNRDILFVEGELSRLGIGNDLFSNSRSISRLICNSKNAFQSYERIVSASKKYGEGKLIILALGPTATILAHDLALAGYWALDLGHIDIEYSWFLEKAKDRIAVRGKAAAEVTSDSFELYDYEKSIYEESIIQYIT